MSVMLVFENALKTKIQVSWDVSWYRWVVREVSKDRSDVIFSVKQNRATASDCLSLKVKALRPFEMSDTAHQSVQRRFPSFLGMFSNTAVKTSDLVFVKIFVPSQRSILHDVIKIWKENRYSLVCQSIWCGRGSTQHKSFRSWFITGTEYEISVTFGQFAERKRITDAFTYSVFHCRGEFKIQIFRWNT